MAVAVAAATIFASLAFAEDQLAKVPFDRVDTGHDGRITFAEFEAFALEALKAKGGTTARLAAAHPDIARERIRARFDAIDTKHQGYIDRSEWPH